MSRPLPNIVHLDADAFFVSVELALQPQYRGKKVAVGGRERGIIASASYEARACGVYTPMPTARALKICPDLILLPHKGSYGDVSRRMFDLCENLTPIVQRNSIDEGYLDVTMCGFKTQDEIVAAIRDLQNRIWQQLQIPVSMGIATNRLVAQIASKLRKPRGFVVVPPGEEAAFLAPLSIGKLPGVGQKTEETLNARGLRIVSDITTLAARCLAPGAGATGERELAATLGSGWPDLVAAARGEDDRPVHTDHEDAKSYSKQETFPADVGDFATIESVAKGMIDELMPDIRADGKRVRTLTVKVRYGDFTQRSAAHSLSDATDLETLFYPHVGPLLRQAWLQRRPLRLVSVKLSGVDAADGVQLDMFARTDDKRRQLAAVLDKLNATAAKGSPPLVRHGHQLRH
ncbi:DNA polymerase IV [Opitutaceae bacterium TAV4]|nr:DNA polymerase IV [Opitutaceae bacterium TAV4]RRK02854.1 DNA polymerase IV [Opitutaceae bacterium TAV3]